MRCLLRMKATWGVLFHELFPHEKEHNNGLTIAIVVEIHHAIALRKKT